MANKQFIAEKQDIKLVSGASTVSKTITAAVGFDAIDEDLENELLIPRRPAWNASTSAEELKQNENEAYLRWRRRLAQLQERDDVILTPFEKNLDFWRQLWRVIERSDVLVQILDARNPLMFHCEDLDRYIKEVDNKKLPVTLLNKADYLNEEQRKIWLDYFHSLGKKCVFFSALQQQKISDEEDEQEQFVDDLDRLHFSDGLDQPLTYTQLIAYFKSYRDELNIKSDKPITIGLIGYPNVGKSSTINALLRVKKVSVSAMPGKTKHFQTIVLNDDVTICDCPGLVFPNFVSSKAEMIISGILPIDQMKNAMHPIELICEKIPAHVFQSLYGIIFPKSDSNAPDQADYKVSALELLSTYGYSRGFMTQRGLPDTSRAARYILKDFVVGRLLFCYAPPNVRQEEFHKFPLSAHSTGNEQPTDRKLLKMLEGNNLRLQDFDETFFHGQNSNAHIKGKTIADGDLKSRAEAIAAGEKPWKKHNNRNKREKLRRVYAHLDT